MKPLKRLIPVVIVSVAAVVPWVRAGARPAPTEKNEGPTGPEHHVLSPEVRRVAEELREKAFSGSKAAEWVRSLTDEVGPRLSGSPQDAVGVAWAVAKLKELGFSNVHAEKVMVPAWQRGIETGEITV